MFLPSPNGARSAAGSVIGAGDADASAAHEASRARLREPLLAVCLAARAAARLPLGNVTLLWSRQIDGIRSAALTPAPGDTDAHHQALL
jgi:hypothetical protein